MRTAKTWQHVVVQAPLDLAPELLPDEISSGPTTLEVLHERTAEGAFWGRDARRFRSRWTRGRREGAAYVELRPHSSRTTEMVVHLEAPKRNGRLWWSRDRLSREALGLALALRYDMDVKAAQRAKRPAKVRSVRSAS